MPAAMTQGIQMKLIIVYSIFVTDHVNLQNFFEQLKNQIESGRSEQNTVEDIEPNDGFALLIILCNNF